PGSRDVQRLAVHLDDVGPALFVDLHRDRIRDQRLGGEQLDLKPVGDAERAQRRLRTVGRSVLRRDQRSVRQQDDENGQRAQQIRQKLYFSASWTVRSPTFLVIRPNEPLLGLLTATSQFGW